ncbi:MAG TPA: DMT family transporter [Patescibacteria group bacterium]|nr:DMT family transporter [Patescibacteria group bacterium]
MGKILQKGIFFAVITALISGFSIFYNKLVLIKGIDPLNFNILKNGGVAFFLSILFISFSGKRMFFIKNTVRHWWKLLCIGIIGGSIPFYLFFEGLKMTSALNATLIHKTLFIWVALMAIPFLGERLSFFQVIGYFFIIFSTFFIGEFSNVHFGHGELMIIGATLLWSVETILSKIFLKNISSMILAWGRMFFGTLFLIFIALFQGRLQTVIQVPTTQLFPLLGSILFLIGYVTSWYYALQLAPATTVTVVLVLSIPITNILTALFITHTLTSLQFTNNVLITVSVACIIFSLPSIRTYVKRLSTHNS